MYHLLHTHRMYDELPMTHNTYSMVLKVVTEQSPINSESVARNFELAPGHIQQILRNLHQARLIYVKEYRPDKRNCLRPWYAAGDEMDAEKPPIKYATERRKERLLAAKQPFTPRRDVASVWMTHL